MRVIVRQSSKGATVVSYTFNDGAGGTIESRDSDTLEKHLQLLESMAATMGESAATDSDGPDPREKMPRP